MEYLNAIDKTIVALAEQLDTWLALITTEWLPKFKIAKANVSFLAISALAALDAIQKEQQTFRAFARTLTGFPVRRLQLSELCADI